MRPCDHVGYKEDLIISNFFSPFCWRELWFNVHRFGVTFKKKKKDLNLKARAHCTDLTSADSYSQTITISKSSCFQNIKHV